MYFLFLILSEIKVISLAGVKNEIDEQMEIYEWGYNMK